MKLWRKLGNKVVIDLTGEPVQLTGRQFKRYQQIMSSPIKPASKLLSTLIKRI